VREEVVAYGEGEKEMKMRSPFCKVTLVIVAALSTLLLARAQAPAENPLGPYIPKNIKPYYLDMLSLEAKPETALPENERTQWMQKHLAYIRSQVEAGKFVLVGPITEENRLRGIAVIKADSLEEAQRIAAGDPLVQSGHLVVEVHPIMLEDLSSIRFEYPGPAPQ
jgi:uncharacterized protein YciI